MISFVHYSALAGLIAIAIPIIIHLIKINQRRQTIPSLLLFTALKKTSRRHKLQNLLLLIARILIVALLVLLLSRPFIEWSRNYLKAGDSERVVLGIVLDDSLTSFVSVDGEMVFERARSQALAQLKQLSDDSAVLIATTSSGVCSKAMSVEQAKKILNSIANIPVAGNLGLAIENTVKRLKVIENYHYGAIWIAAPPVQSLWRSVDLNEIDLPSKLVSVNLISDKKFDPVVTGIQRIEQPSNGYLVQIQGDPYVMTKGSLVIRNRGGQKLYSMRPDLDTAVKQRIFIPREKVGDSGTLSAHFRPMAGSGQSPLLSYYHEPITKKKKGKIFIIYDHSKISGIYAQLIFIALEVVLEDFRKRIVFINYDEDVDQLDHTIAPEAVFLTPMNDYGKVNKWLVGILSKGRRVIAFPNARQEIPLPGLPEDSWPKWQAESIFKGAKPMVLINSPALNKTFIRLYTRGLNHVRLKAVSPVVATERDIRIFACDNKTVLLERNLEGGGRIYCWGVHLNKNALPLLSNPLFPQVAKQLIGDEEDKNLSDSLFLGATVSISQWLGLTQGSGRCMLPDGNEMSLNWSPNRPDIAYLEQEGFYYFKIKARRIKDDQVEESEMAAVRTVNCPRLPVKAMNLKLFRETLPESIDVTTALSGIQFHRITVRDKKPLAGGGKVTEDLTPLVALFLWAFIIAEMLFITWNRKGGGGGRSA